MTTTSTYAMAKLGSVCDLLAGYAWNSDGFNSDGDGLPIIRIQNVANDNGKDFVYWNGSYDPRFLIELGDILLSLSGSFRADKWSGPKALLNQRVVKLCVRPGLDENWLLTCLRQKLGQIERMGRHALVNNVSLGDLKNLEIPLPPLPEQRRIAAILDKADAIRRKREEGIRLTEELLRSTFLEMFGDPATNPKGWPTKAMGDVVQETQYGTAEKSNSDAIGLPVLRMNNITYGGEIDLSDLKWCEIKETDLEQLTVKRGDLLFNRTNSPELVGKTAVWDRDERYAYAGYLFRVRFHESMILPDYVSGFLNSAYGKKMIFAKAKPSNNMSNFSAGEFCRIELPIPDIGIQRRFATVVAEIKRLKDKRAAGLKDAMELFGALVQRAFRGEL